MLFGEGLFSDPAWDVLLQLYAAELGNRRITVEEIVRTVEAPESTTRRWLGVLCDRGMILVEMDAADQKASVVLGPATSDAMTRLVNHWVPAFYSI